MGQRIYRVDPPDVAGDVYDDVDAARLVGSGLYSRQRPAVTRSRPPATRSRRPSASASSSTARPSSSSTEG